MLYSFAELCRKEVIDVEKGEKLGYVDDLEFDAQTAAVAALVIHGRERLFGLLGREQDLMIPFRQIRLIGTDTILVVREAEHGSTDSAKCTMSGRFHIEDLFK
ncbi:PRC-barrel domain-containing protein [Ruminococcus champanellensis]